MTAAYPALAVDVGGTKFAAGLVEPGGRVISWAQTATPQELDAEQLWRTLDALITRIRERDVARSEPAEPSAAEAPEEAVVDA